MEYSEKETTVAERIKIIISKNNLTQTEFAQRLNISPSMVSKICSGAAEPSYRTISDICKTFGVDACWLETGFGEMYSVNAKDELLAIFAGQTLGGTNHPIYREFMEVLADSSISELYTILRIARRLVVANEPHLEEFINISQKSPANQKETPPEDPEA